MKRPIIGVTPDYNSGDREDMGGKEPTYFLRARYLQAIEEAGGIPLVLPLVTDLPRQRLLLSHIDGLMVTGSGSDLAPETYGERQRFRFRRMSRQRSDLELGMSRLAFQANVPVLGICGGMQSMNVALGGTLIQDIPSQMTTSISHQPPGSATKPAHAITVASGSLLRRITRRATIRVNSSHHQSVKKVGRLLVASAVAADGIIEAIEASSRRFFLGVQWHPEFLYTNDPIQRRLFQALVKAARAFSSSRGQRM